LILHEDGAIWKKHDGYPSGLAIEIFDYYSGNYKYFDFKGLFNYLNEHNKSSHSEKELIYRKIKDEMLDAEYVYRITDSGLYVKGILTNDEENELLFGDGSNYGTIIDKINSFRRLVLDDNDELCFVDIDEEIKKVTK